MAKRVFISFAIEDANSRDLLVGQARNTRTPIELIDYSVKEPWSNAWKTQCRERIRGCSGFIALLSKNTLKADGARWEIKCADEEGIPMIGVYIHKEDRGAISVPAELSGHKLIDWTWDGIAAFLQSL